MSDFRVKLHPQQMEVFTDPRRFKIVVAGRRWGKSRLALYDLAVSALQAKEADVYYVAPTQEMARRIMWRLMKQIYGMADKGGLVQWAHENTLTMRLVNDRQIQLCGSDNPDSLRGVAMSKCVLDEYASMKPMVWEEIIRPALMDVQGGALFIGTPAGKNHFYDLYTKHQQDPDWGCWQFKSSENPYLSVKELESAFAGLSTQTARQELEASFESFSMGVFKEEWVRYEEEPEDGDWIVVVDLAGFEAASGKRGTAGGKLDESAVWAIKVHKKGWWLGHLEHGRWDIRETALRILRTAQERHARVIGIERGALLNAVMPYLEEQMRRVNFYPRIEPTTHGGKAKIDRVVWALQGRFERGAITLNRAPWNRAFISQLLDFPNHLAHDDLVDALAYAAQVAITPTDYNGTEDDEYEPVDLVAGY